jgi:hypothetical protein
MEDHNTFSLLEELDVHWIAPDLTFRRFPCSNDWKGEFSEDKEGRDQESNPKEAKDHYDNVVDQRCDNPIGDDPPLFIDDGVRVLVRSARGASNPRGA